MRQLNSRGNVLLIYISSIIQELLDILMDTLTGRFLLEKEELNGLKLVNRFIMEIERYYKKVIESLRLLSLNFNEQKEYFPEFVDIPFEILDTFEHAFLLVPQLLESNKISYDVVPDLLRLHLLISSKIENLDFDNLEVEKLCNSDEWNTIRELSTEIIKQMGEPFAKPDSNYI